MRRKPRSALARALTYTGAVIGTILTLWAVSQVALAIFGEPAWQRDWWVLAATLAGAAVSVLASGFGLFAKFWSPSFRVWLGFHLLVLAIGAAIAFA